MTRRAVHMTKAQVEALRKAGRSGARRVTLPPPLLASAAGW